MARNPRNLASKLNIDVHSILCPQCDSQITTIMEILSPEDMREAIVGTWTRTAVKIALDETIVKAN